MTLDYAGVVLGIAIAAFGRWGIPIIYGVYLYRKIRTLRATILLSEGDDLLAQAKKIIQSQNEVIALVDFATRVRDIMAFTSVMGIIFATFNILDLISKLI